MYAREILFAIELLFWLPAFLTSLFVVRKHGASKQLGWISLTMLSVFRITGATCGIIAICKPSKAVIEISMIANGVGLISLIVCLCGVISRVNMNMYEHRFMTPIRAKILHLPVIVAVILSIFAAVGMSTDEHGNVSQDLLYSRIAIGLVTGVYLVVVFVTVESARHRIFVLEREQPLLRASLIAIPFISIRLLYAWLAEYLPSSYPFSVFAESTVAVIIRALMSVLEECIVAGMFLGAGLKVDKAPAKTTKSLRSGQEEGVVEMAFDKLVEAVHHQR